jgi:PBP1b-binding outer membrane lipoprotein LpoB
MKSFKNWLKLEFSPIAMDLEVDARDIERIYNKAKISVSLVKMFSVQTGRPQLLHNVASIINLASGAYGLFNTGDMQTDIDTAVSPDKQQQLIFMHKGNLQKKDLEKTAQDVLKGYFPDMDERKLKPKDVVQININRILSDPRINDDVTAIETIASTIVHEAQHDLEYRQKKQTSEMGPETLEREFKAWVKDSQVQQYIHSELQKYGPSFQFKGF